MKTIYGTKGKDGLYHYEFPIKKVTKEEREQLLASAPLELVYSKSIEEVDYHIRVWAMPNGQYLVLIKFENNICVDTVDTLIVNKWIEIIEA